MSMNEEYTPLTPAQRAALAEQREAQAQLRRRAAQSPAPVRTAPPARPAAAPAKAPEKAPAKPPVRVAQRPQKPVQAPKKPLQSPVKPTAEPVVEKQPRETYEPLRQVHAVKPSQVLKMHTETEEEASGTREYPKQPRSGTAPERIAHQQLTAEIPAVQKEDTNEFPTYVRAGKLGFRLPKFKKNRQTTGRRHHRRRKLDARFKAALLALAALALIFVILLCCGVRYTKTQLGGENEIRFFGIVQDGEPKNGWLSYTNGMRGSLKNGEKIVYADGSVYEGDIVGLLREGRGTLTYANGDVYVGAYVEDEKCGEGVLTYANGDRYEGAFREDLRHGEGVLTYADGSVFTGTFADGRKNGQGTYQKGDSVFTGTYVNDIKEGYGEQIFANGDTYKGNYENDMRNGHGVYTFANGEIYDGNFKDNERYGQCTYTWPSGRTTSGWFENGQIVS